MFALTRAMDCGVVAKARNSSAASRFGVPATITSWPKSSNCPSQMISKGWLSSIWALKMRPLYAVVMATSPSASSWGGWAPASHHTIWSLMVSSLRNARSIPPGVSSSWYTSAGGTPSAMSANSMLPMGLRRIPRRPGKVSRSKKSCMVRGSGPGMFSRLYAMTVA